MENWQGHSGEGNEVIADGRGRICEARGKDIWWTGGEWKTKPKQTMPLTTYY